MSIFNIPNWRRYWEKSDYDPVNFGISKFMGRNKFQRFQAMFELPGSEHANTTATDPIFGNCLVFLDAC